MIIDYNLVLSDAQDISGAAGSDASTSYLDQLAAGDAIGDGCWAQFLIDTAFAGTAGSSITFALQTDDNASFTSPTTVMTRSMDITELTAGVVPICAQLPLHPNGMQRYIRGYYTSTAALSAGKVDLRIVKDVDKTLDKVL